MESVAPTIFALLEWPAEQIETISMQNKQEQTLVKAVLLLDSIKSQTDSGPQSRFSHATIGRTLGIRTLVVQLILSCF